MALSGQGVRLVAFDLDGTVLEHGRDIAPVIVQALRTIAAAGVRCVTATGRPLAFQVELFTRHGLGTAAGVPHAFMADERELYLLGRSHTNPTGAADGDGEPGGPGYRPHADWNDAVKRRWRGLHPLAMDWLARAEAEAARRGWLACRHLTEAEADARGLPTLALAMPEYAAALCGWLARTLDEAGLPLACNRNVRLVQIHDAAVGKGPVLAELVRLWRIRPYEVLAIGDSANDLSMLDGRLGFRCATVANAEDGVKDVVRRAGGYVAAGHAGTGLIEALEALGVLSAAGTAAIPGLPPPRAP